ncbi:MAG: hypothetical protein AAB328_08045 [candidate division NC10 bacterium]
MGKALPPQTAAEPRPTSSVPVKLVVVDGPDEGMEVPLDRTVGATRQSWSERSEGMR